MDFQEQVATIAKRIETLKEHTLTEEATKNAFLMPFIAQVLGFDIFNPMEVRPECVADVRGSKGEKVDYALFKDGKMVLAVECKHWSVKLTLRQEGQLQRYFEMTETKFALLTNGIEYRFYTDLDAPNKMDMKPFLVFNIFQRTDSQLRELERFTRQNFDTERIRESARQLKYISAMREELEQFFRDPTDEQVRLFARNAYEGKVSQKALDVLKPLFKTTLAQYISDQVRSRFDNAMAAQEPDAANIPMEMEDDGIVTTEEELEGYEIVKAIASKKVDSHRIAYRDAKSYFAILLDDKNNRPICRLYYNRNKKYVGLFNDPKNFLQGGAKTPRMVEVPGDNPNSVLSKFTSDLLQTIDWYENPENVPQP